MDQARMEEELLAGALKNELARFGFDATVEVRDGPEGPVTHAAVAGRRMRFDGLRRYAPDTTVAQVRFIRQTVCALLAA